MTEYIKRETAVDTILGEPTDAHYQEWYASILMGLPSADVAPVVHGQWIESKEHFYLQNGCKEWTNFYCSECDAPNNSPTNYCPNYCPNCGANMDGDN